jgi:hypothetical protein
MIEKTFALSEDEFSLLILALGYATGAAMKLGENKLAASFIRLSTRVNKDNPAWVPYAEPKEGL